MYEKYLIVLSELLIITAAEANSLVFCQTFYSIYQKNVSNDASKLENCTCPFGQILYEHQPTISQPPRKYCFDKCANCTNGFCIENTCTCFPGKSKYATGVCEQICPNCHNGWCSSAYKCECNSGYALSKSGSCEPSCKGGCPDGTCSEGYKRSNLGLCEPECPGGCDFGTCVDPDVCICNNGYQMGSSKKCEPVCDNECPNGYCSEVGVCTCYKGYKRSAPDDFCEPVCEDACPDGFCKTPGVCSCFPGFTNISGICEALCSNDCINGYCVGPEKCVCFIGYMQYASNHCEIFWWAAYRRFYWLLISFIIILLLACSLWIVTWALDYIDIGTVSRRPKSKVGNVSRSIPVTPYHAESTSCHCTYFCE